MLDIKFLSLGFKILGFAIWKQRMLDEVDDIAWKWRTLVANIVKLDDPEHLSSENW